MEYDHVQTPTKASLAASCSLVAWSPSSSAFWSCDRNWPSTSATALQHASLCSKHDLCTSLAAWSFSSMVCSFCRRISFLFSSDSIWRSEDSRCLSIFVSSAESASWHSRSLSWSTCCFCPTPSDPGSAAGGNSKNFGKQNSKTEKIESEVAFQGCSICLHSHSKPKIWKKKKVQRVCSYCFS